MAIAVGGVVLAAAAGGIRQWVIQARDAEDREALLADIAESRANRARTADGEVPHPTAEEEETAELYMKAAAAIRPALFRVTGIVNIPGGTSKAPSEVSIVEGHSEALALLEEIGRRGAPRFADARFLGTPGLYQLPRLLASRGRIELQRGDYAASVKTLALLHRIARDFQRIPVDVDTEMAFPWGTGAESAAWRLLTEIATSPGLGLADAEAALSTTGGEGVFNEWLRRLTVPPSRFDDQCERAVGADAQVWFAGVRGSPPDIASRFRNLLGGLDSIPEYRLPRPGEVRAMRTAADAAAAAMLRKDVTALAPLGPVDRSFEQWPESGIGPEALGAIQPPNFRMALHLESQFGVSRAVIAIRVFQLRRGRAPSSIEELVPGVLDAVPLDPFDGKPMKYGSGRPDAWVVGSRVWSGGFTHPSGFTEILRPVEVQFPAVGR